MNAKIGAVYLCVKDMDKAIAFYEELFGKAVENRDEKMSSFSLDGITLLLYNYQYDNEEITFGNNVIVNIEVDNISESQKFAEEKKCKIVMPPKKIENYSIFQIQDYDGNVIEFYQII